MHEITTWRDVLDFLETLTPGQLDLPAAILPPEPDGDKVVELMPIYLAGTIAEMEVMTRSADDNLHHPGRPVLMCDYNPFDEDGAMAIDLETGERIFPKGNLLTGELLNPEG